MMKFCPRCEQTLPSADFVPNTARTDGLSGYCRKCVYAYNVEREARLRAAAIAALGGKCVRCETIDPRVLAIDHRYGSGNQQRRAGLKQSRFYIYVVAHQDEFQLLCHNCNWIKRLEHDAFVAPATTETVTAG